jgi:hypothetical protein
MIHSDRARTERGKSSPTEDARDGVRKSREALANADHNR